jgi:hypothetical protein
VTHQQWKADSDRKANQEITPQQELLHRIGLSLTKLRRTSRADQTARFPPVKQESVEGKMRTSLQVLTAVVEAQSNYPDPAIQETTHLAMKHIRLLAKRITYDPSAIYA